MQALVASIRSAPTPDEAERILRAALVSGVVIASESDEHGRTVETIVHSSVRVSAMRFPDGTSNT